MKTFTAINCVALLVGCAGAPKAIERVVEVKIPIPTPCISKAPERPVWATTDPSLVTSVYDRFVAVLRELAQRREYEHQLEALVDSCK